MTGAAKDGVDVSTMDELVRHRCLVRTAADNSELYPYPYTYTEAVRPIIMADPAG